MNQKTLTGGLFALFMTGQAALAGSAPLMKARCNEDSLEPNPAKERIEWAGKCNYITSSEKEYSLKDGGADRPRPLYPMFGTEDYSQLWKAPVDRNAPCTTPEGMSVVAFCTASCYTPDQQVLFPDGFEEIASAKEQVLPDVMALRSTSTFDNLKLISYPVESYTEEVRPSDHQVLTFKMKSGGSLQVTMNHPIVDGKGIVKRAEKFKVGESLIHYLNGRDRIESIAKDKYFGKVYNLAPATRLPVSNILVAQGYLNGSSYFQNDGEDLQNRKLLRRTISDKLLK